MDFRHEPPVLDSIPTTRSSLSPIATISDPKGQLLFYIGEQMVINKQDHDRKTRKRHKGLRIWNREHQVMQNGREKPPFSKISTQSPLVVSPAIVGDMAIISQNESIYHIFYPYRKHIPDTMVALSGLYYTTVDMRMDGGMGGVPPGQWNQRLLKGHYAGAEVVQKPGGGHWLATRTGDTLMAIPVTRQGIGKPVKSPIPSEARANQLVTDFDMEFSHDGNFMVNVLMQARRHNYDTCCPISYTAMYAYDFDKQSGKFSNQEQIHYSKDSFDAYNQKRLQAITFAPNDSLFYVGGDQENYNDGVNKTLFQYKRYASDIKSSKVGVDLKRDIIPGFSVLKIRDLALAPNGKIYGSVLSGSLFVIDHPNKRGEACQVILNQVPLNNCVRCNCPRPPCTISACNDWEKENCGVSFIASQYNTYRRLQYRYRVNPSCKKVRFNCVAHESFKRFKYFIYRNGNLVDSIDTANFVYHYQDTGLAYVKLKAWDSSGYFQWFSDTIPLTEPGRLKANFAITNDTACQYNATQFKDASETDTVNPNKSPSWAWYIEDSVYHNQNPLHKFQKTGKHPVTLIYSNGYCSDTITKQEAIYVQRAVQPGFTVKPDTGCEPMEVSIQAPAHGDTPRYHYDAIFNQNVLYASDKQEPTFLLDSPGVNTTSQTLTHKYTGCKTFDTQTVKVYEGLGPEDHPTLEKATVLEDSAILVKWEADSSAASSVLYRHPGTYSDTMKTRIKSASKISHKDFKVQPSEQSYTYQLKMIDQCRQLSGYSNISKSMLLTGFSEGNEYAKLHWNPYKKWEQGVDHYTVWGKIDGKSYQKISKTNNTSFQDPAFGEKAKTKSAFQCYYIKAHQAAGKLTSKSNAFCVYFEPQLWIPKAFSPNGDDINDIFSIKGLGLEKATLTIYNQWGQQVYQGDAIEEGWDGTHQGTQAKKGIYLYLIEAISKQVKQFHKQGTLHLLR